MISRSKSDLTLPSFLAGRCTVRPSSYVSMCVHGDHGASWSLFQSKSVHFSFQFTSCQFLDFLITISTSFIGMSVQSVSISFSLSNSRHEVAPDDNVEGCWMRPILSTQLRQRWTTSRNVFLLSSVT